MSQYAEAEERASYTSKRLEGSDEPAVQWVIEYRAAGDTFWVLQQTYAEGAHPIEWLTERTLEMATAYPQYAWRLKRTSTVTIEVEILTVAPNTPRQEVS